MDLCGDDDVVAVPAKVLDCSAHDFLGLSACVSLGAVEKVDSGIVGGFEAGKCLFCTTLAAWLRWKGVYG